LQYYNYNILTTTYKRNKPTLTLNEIHKHYKASLKGSYPKEEISNFFYLLCQHKLQLDRVSIALTPLLEISEEDQHYFKKVLIRLKKNEPIQYIIGETHFFGLQFKVTPATLIPRPETEELVKWIIDNQEQKLKSLKILDIGTGSGCIAISLAKNMINTKVSAIDISTKTLSIAKENAVLNNVKIKFHQIDILKEKKYAEKYDIIVSNPPYVRESEKKEMLANVLDYEPKEALFVTNKQPLIFYKKIGEFAKEHLKPTGNLYFEINQHLSHETLKLMTEIGFHNIEIKKDFLKNDRMLKCNLIEGI